MQQFTLKFEFFGKYLTTTVTARNMDEAKQMVLNRVVFMDCHEVKEPRRPVDPSVEYLRNMFNMK